MQTQSPSRPTPVKASPHPMPRKSEPRAASAWKPQEVGLSRQELREIVIDVIG